VCSDVRKESALEVAVHDVVLVQIHHARED
jgi:hypothetical protein